MFCHYLLPDLAESKTQALSTREGGGGLKMVRRHERLVISIKFLNLRPKLFRCFSQALQENPSMATQTGDARFLLNSVQLHCVFV